MVIYQFLCEFTSKICYLVWWKIVNIKNRGEGNDGKKKISTNLGKMKLRKWCGIWGRESRVIWAGKSLPTHMSRDEKEVGSSGFWIACDGEEKEDDEEIVGGIELKKPCWSGYCSVILKCPYEE